MTLDQKRIYLNYCRLSCLASIAQIISSVDINLLIDPLFYALDRLNWLPAEHAYDCMRAINLARQVKQR